jgi:hypothetical protein
MKEIQASQRSHDSSDLESWYEGELRGKVVRAVEQGRVDPAQADELHRLMSALLERRLSQRA